jgi:hypothetical protein
MPLAILNGGGIFHQRSKQRLDETLHSSFRYCIKKRGAGWRQLQINLLASLVRLQPHQTGFSCHLPTENGREVEAKWGMFHDFRAASSSEDPGRSGGICFHDSLQRLIPLGHQSSVGHKVWKH